MTSKTRLNTIIKYFRDRLERDDLGPVFNKDYIELSLEFLEDDFDPFPKKYYKTISMISRGQLIKGLDVIGQELESEGLIGSCLNQNDVVDQVTVLYNSVQNYNKTKEETLKEIRHLYSLLNPVKPSLTITEPKPTFLTNIKKLWIKISKTFVRQ